MVNIGEGSPFISSSAVASLSVLDRKNGSTLAIPAWLVLISHSDSMSFDQTRASFERKMVSVTVGLAAVVQIHGGSLAKSASGLPRCRGSRAIEQTPLHAEEICMLEVGCNQSHGQDETAIAIGLVVSMRMACSRTI